MGYALGYSLLHGLTEPKERAKNTSYAINLHTTSKSYPAAIDAKMGPTIPKGKRFHYVAYRQYFRPSAQKNATCLYWHEEDGGTVVYADYHKSVDRDVLELPGELRRKKIKVLEKTPSLKLHTLRKVTGKGLVVSVKGDYGYVVLVLK